MSSGSVLAGLTLRGSQKLGSAIGRRQSTMNDVHAVAIQSHYAAVMHQNEHAQHLESIKQAHSIAGDRGFKVTTNNRSFVVGDSPGSPKKSKKSKGPKGAASEASPETPSMGGGSGSPETAPSRPAIEARESKSTPLAIEAKPSSFDNGNIWRMGTSGVKPAAPAGQHSAASPRQFVTGPEGTTRRVDRTDSSFEENLSANEDRYLAERRAKQSGNGGN